MGFEELRDKIADLSYEGTAEDATYWFVSCMIAQDLAGTNGTKDWAHLLLHGCKPIKDRPSAVDEWLAEQEEIQGDGFAAWLDEALGDFF
jgi:hypothetical protein